LAFYIPKKVKIGKCHMGQSPLSSIKEGGNKYSDIPVRPKKILLFYQVALQKPNFSYVTIFSSYID